MNIQHSYTINNLTRKKQEGDLQNVVTEVDFTLKSIDLDTPTGEYDTVTSRVVKLKSSDIVSEDFIPYENLTQQIVLSWILEKSIDLELYHEKIMNDLFNPPELEYVEESPPWV